MLFHFAQKRRHHFPNPATIKRTKSAITTPYYHHGADACCAPSSSRNLEVIRLLFVCIAIRIIVIRASPKTRGLLLTETSPLYIGGRVRRSQTERATQ